MTSQSKYSLGDNELRMLHMGKELAEYYAKFRPTYDAGLYKTIVESYESDKRRSCNYELAIDVGCGPGQSTLPLAKYFNHVIGVDISEDQIAHAPRDLDGVKFKEGDAEDFNFLQDGFVDLVAAGAACHWFDQQKFAKEVERVLKPGGVLANYCYEYPIVEHALGNDAYCKYLKVVKDSRVLNTSNIQELYRVMPLPFAAEQRLEEIYFEDKSMMKIKYPFVLMLGRKPH